MVFEQKCLVLVKLMLNAGKSSSMLPLKLVKKAKGNRKAKELYIQVPCFPDMLSIPKISFWGSQSKISYETWSFMRKTLTFHGMSNAIPTNEEKERFIKEAHMIVAIKRSKGHIKDTKQIRVNVRQLEIPETALILFGGSSVTF